MFNRRAHFILLSIILLTALVLRSGAQSVQRFTISGYITDARNGESIPGANVLVKGTLTGAQTNAYGFYSLTLPAGDYILVYSYIGASTQELTVTLHQDMKQNLALQSGAIQGKEVVITDRRRDQNIRNTEMGTIQLSTDRMKKLPALMGEVDLLKVMQLMPGVQAAGEGNAGFYVRGGGPDQNLILLDEAPVYNTGHLFGFFSIFNADAIKDVKLIKGGMPANYGGRLSSVMDVSMKEGNNKAFEVEGGLGAIASRLSIQGPIQQDKSSFMLSARRTYVDILTKPFIPKDSDFYGSGYYFYDLNAKANYRFSDKDRVYVSAYMGKDVFTFNNRERAFDAHIPWGNATATLRWNHVFSNKLFANTSLIYNDYKFEFSGSQSDFNIRMKSGIRDLNAKLDFDYFLNSKHHLKFGGNYIYHQFRPSSISGVQDTTTFNPDNTYKKFAHEAALYIQDDWEISSTLKVNAGLRYSGFQQIGPYTAYERDTDGNKLDSTSWGKGVPVRSYGWPEPRVIVRYAWNNANSLKASVTRNNQFIHLVTNAGSSLPTDIWVPSTYRVKPQIAWQYSAGYFRNFSNNDYEASIEAYFKDMQNQVEYREGYTPSTTDPEEDFVFGKGWAYGAEVFVKKNKGKFTGWLGYTLAWTWRRFPDLNDGNKFPAKYDRRHDLAVVATYDKNERWSFSGVFIFGSGNTTTLPEKFYFIEGVLRQESGSINSYRMEPYHRLDLSAIYTPKKKRFNNRVQGSWAFSVYNVYSRMNPYFMYFYQKGNVADGTLQLKGRKVSLFPVLPSATWNFKF
ncbi:TonB-dependent receptor [Chitinophaga horti]|uniref:TonB-dependent receptor n=1 Tax=Chitinophaga horti TaxID=2920382 RepID=A0ABY6J690_9BACT|nr:TonB-dependent receptor [Chitinophaga horti]UYQ95198.1 TonB-dependent receptor [Chitinophaga horti]